MAVLAFDTSTQGCSAAVIAEGAVLAYAFETMTRGQAERLLPMIDAVMQSAGQTFDALDLVATTTGPGAFTGLRIGLSAAQGISYAAQTPGVGMTTFDALVAGFMTAESQAGRTSDAALVVVVESKREDVFVQVFDPEGRVLTEPQSLKPEDIPSLLPDGQCVLLGDAASRVLDGLGPAYSGVSVATGPGLVDARDLGRLAEQRLKAGAPLGPLTPLYMRPPDAIVPKDGGRLRPLAGGE